MRRCIAIGLDKDDTIVAKLFNKMVNVGLGYDTLTNRVEVSNNWMDLGIDWVTPGNIALLDKYHPTLEKPWEVWTHLVKVGFASGTYKKTDEVKGFLEITGRTPTPGQIKKNGNGFIHRTIILCKGCFINKQKASGRY